MSTQLPVPTDGWKPPLASIVGKPRLGFFGRLLQNADPQGFVVAFSSEAHANGLTSTKWSKVVEIAETFRVDPESARTLLVSLTKEWAGLLSGESFFSARTSISNFAIDAGLGDAAASALRERGLELLSTSLNRVPDDRISFDLARSTAEAFCLTPEDARQAFQNRAQVYLSATLQRLLQDGELSPQDRDFLNDAANRLGVRQIYTDNEAANIRDGAMAWAIRNSSLPVIAAPVNMQKGEQAYRAVSATAWQSATKSHSVGYSGVSTNIRLMKGVYYRVGSIQSHRVTEAYDKQVGTGQLIVTNKRLVFLSPERPSASTLKSILHIEPYSDAIVITRTSGKPTTYRFASEDKWFGAILSRAIVEANG